MTKAEGYLALAILLALPFVIAPRLHGMPEWTLGVLVAIEVAGLLALKIWHFGPDE